MRISGWLFLAQQTMAALCLLLAVGRCLGASAALTRRAVLCAAALGCMVTGAAVSGSAAVRLTLAPIAAAMPVLAFPALFPASLRALPGVTLLALLMALGWSQLMARLLQPSWPGMLLVCGLLLFLPRLLPSGAAPRHARLDVRIGSRHVRAEALVDTGNLLRDPVTGLPVVVLAPKVLARLTPPPTPDTLSPGMRLMPVRTFSGPAMLVLLRPDALLIDGRPVRALVSPAPDPQPHFQALVPGCLFSHMKTGG